MPNSISDNLQRLVDAREDIYEAIAAKGGTVASGDGFEDFADAIRTIQANPTLITKSITENGTYDASDDSADGYSEVTVAVPETYAMLFVTTEAGTTITVSKGQTILPTQTCVSGEELVFNIPESGTWTVSGSNSVSDTVSISSQGSFYIEIITVHIYGVSWGKSSSTVLTRTDEAVNFSDPNPYYAGMSGEPSSPFDNIMPWSGMTKETIDGNVLVKIPKFWYKITNTSSALTIQIANRPQDGFSVSPAHQARNSRENDRDYVYIGRYKCDSSYKSTSSSSPITMITRATARSGITSLGTGYHIQDFAMFWTIRMLYLVEFADWDSQTKIGYGCGNGRSTEKTGGSDSMTYHTGTTQYARTTVGIGVQYRYIEDPWGNVREWVDGISFYNQSVYIYTDPSTYSDSSDGTYIGSRKNSSDYIKGWLVPSGTLDWALYPNSVGGSSNDYVPDDCVYGDYGVVLSVGGSFYNQNLFYGFFFLDGSSSTSGSNSYTGARLQYLP